MPVLIRVFRATIKPEAADEFRGFFLGDALSLVQSQQGMIRATVGLPSEQAPNEYLMISEWDGLASLKKFAGDQWNQAVIDPREAHLLSSAHVHHYWRAD